MGGSRGATGTSLEVKASGRCEGRLRAGCSGRVPVALLDLAWCWLESRTATGLVGDDMQHSDSISTTAKAVVNIALYLSSRLYT